MRRSWSPACSGFPRRARVWAGVRGRARKLERRRWSIDFAIVILEPDRVRLFADPTWRASPSEKRSLAWKRRDGPVRAVAERFG
jgi:hypothetical protein